MISLLQTRRSIRKYVSTPLNEQFIESIKEALLRSPSSRNNKPCEFIFVDNSNTLEKLSLAKTSGSAFLKNASLGIVVCGDSSKSDVWVEDCSIASIIVQLQAHSLGLGTCWIQIRNRSHDSEMLSEKYVQDLLNIPSNICVESIIAVGYPNEIKMSVPKEDLDYSKIHMNSY